MFLVVLYILWEKEEKPVQYEKWLWLICCSVLDFCFVFQWEVEEAGLVLVNL